MGSGPFDTTSVTVSPGRTGLSLSVTRMTLPSATSSLYSSSVVTESLTAARAEVASPTLRPETSGIAPAETSNDTVEPSKAAQPFVQSTASPPPGGVMLAATTLPAGVSVNTCDGSPDDVM